MIRELVFCGLDRNQLPNVVDVDETRSGMLNATYIECVLAIAAVPARIDGDDESVTRDESLPIESE